ncbi:MAG: class I SAM-dependent methyltransferase [Bdellovibrionales bacterium]|nr:class I SAM-dependent methyltransferase [Oligoflexia bacterium]
MRHFYVTEKTKEMIGTGQRVLDIGCALGQLTHLLKGVAREVWCMDISPTAAIKAHQNLAQMTSWSGFKVIAGSATELPFADATFKILLLSDGLVGWELSPELQLDVLKEVHRVLEPGGFAILTDYLNPRDFEKHKNHVLKGPLKFIKTEFLGDRIGFQLANNLKPFSDIWPISSILGSFAFNKFLSRISIPLGPSMSKHMSIILQK